MNFNLGWIRYQLQHPEEDVFPVQGIHMFDKQKIPDAMLGVNVLHQSESEKSYFIVFDVQGKGDPHRVGVMLPGPNGRDSKFFMDLKNIKHQEANVTLNHYAVSFEDKLKFPFLAHHIWNEPA